MQIEADYRRYESLKQIADAGRAIALIWRNYTEGRLG